MSFCREHGTQCEVEKVFCIKHAELHHCYLAELRLSEEGIRYIVRENQLSVCSSEDEVCETIWKVWPDAWNSSPKQDVVACYCSTWAFKERREFDHVIMCITGDKAYILWQY